MMEKPIIFNREMVRAILEGRKTQTRRIVKPGKDINFGCALAPGEIAGEVNCGVFTNSPFGQPGDRLWVRETWQGPLIDDIDAYRSDPSVFQNPKFCEYAADGGPAPEFVTMDDELVQRWRPSIHMPRWASRTTLEITGLRVERLQDISEADAKSEGSDCLMAQNCNEEDKALLDLPLYEIGNPYRNGYALLWESIYGPGGWNANPLVWVIEFKIAGNPA